MASKRKQGSTKTRKSQRADAEAAYLIVESIGVVGTTEHGEHVGMELRFITGERATVLFPTPYYQKLMAALMSAGAAAQAERLAWLGSEQAVLDWTGAEPFVPTDWAFGRAQNREGIDVLMMRLMKNSLPVIDVALSLDGAERFSLELSAELLKGPADPRPVH